MNWLPVRLCWILLSVFVLNFDLVWGSANPVNSLLSSFINSNPAPTINLRIYSIVPTNVDGASVTLIDGAIASANSLALKENLGIHFSHVNLDNQVRNSQDLTNYLYTSILPLYINATSNNINNTVIAFITDANSALYVTPTINATVNSASSNIFSLSSSKIISQSGRMKLPEIPVYPVFSTSGDASTNILYNTFTFEVSVRDSAYAIVDTIAYHYYYSRVTIFYSSSPRQLQLLKGIRARASVFGFSINLILVSQDNFTSTLNSIDSSPLYSCYRSTDLTVSTPCRVYVFLLSASFANVIYSYLLHTCKSSQIILGPAISASILALHNATQSMNSSSIPPCIINTWVQTGTFGQHSLNSEKYRSLIQSFFNTNDPSVPTFGQMLYFDMILYMYKTCRGMLKINADARQSVFFNALTDSGLIGTTGAIQFVEKNDFGAFRIRYSNRILIAALSNNPNVLIYTRGHFYSNRGFVPAINLAQFALTLKYQNDRNITVESSWPADSSAHFTWIPDFFSYQAIPFCGTPPSRRHGLFSIYDTNNDRILTHGGSSTGQEVAQGHTYSYDLIQQYFTPIDLGNTASVKSVYGQSLISSTLTDSYWYMLGGIQTLGVQLLVSQLQLDENKWSLIEAPQISRNSSLDLVTLPRSNAGFFQFVDGSQLMVVVGGLLPQVSTSLIFLTVNVSNPSSPLVHSYTPLVLDFSPFQGNRTYVSVIPSNTRPATSITLCLQVILDPVVGGLIASSGDELVFIFSGTNCKLDPGVVLIYSWTYNIVVPFFTYDSDTISDSVQTSGSKQPPVGLCCTNAIFHDDAFFIVGGVSTLDDDAIWKVDVSCVMNGGIANALNPCGKWTYLSRAFRGPRDAGTLILVGDDILQFSGQDSVQSHNDMWLYSIDSQTQEKLLPDFETPTFRYRSAGDRLSNFLVFFGGLTTDNPTSLSDTIGFNLNTFTFSTLDNSLSPSFPHPRYGHTFVTGKGGLYLFGGTDGTTTYGDLWLLNYIAQVWTLVSASSSVTPPARYYHGSVTYNSAGENYVVVFGGYGGSGLPLRDLYLFIVSVQQWSMLYSSTSSTSPRFFFNGDPAPFVADFGYDIDDQGNLYSIGGLDQFGNDKTNVCRLPLSSYVSLIETRGKVSSVNWTCTLAPLPSNASGLSSTISGDYIYVTGGLQSPYYTEFFLIYEISKNRWLSTNVLNYYTPIATAYGLMVFYANSLYLFGGLSAVASNLQKPLVNGASADHRIWKITLGPPCIPSSLYSTLVANNKDLIYQPALDSQKSVYQFTQYYTSVTSSNSTPVNLTICTPCSPGTIYSPLALKCVSCPAGSYKPPSSNDCTLCPAGTFNSLASSEGLDSCIPCADGYKSTQDGSSFCSPCDSNEFCPVGTSEPQDVTTISDQFKNNSYWSSSQPRPLERPSAEVETYTVGILSALAGLFFLFLFTYSICEFAGFDLDFLAEYDFLYSAYHKADMDEPKFIRQTRVGGLVTFFSIIFVIGFVISLLLPFILDNYNESHALIPNILVSDPIISNINVSTSLYGYSAYCVPNPSNPLKNSTFLPQLETAVTPSSCAPNIFIQSKNINFLNQTTGGSTSLSCKLTNDTARGSVCTVTYVCTKCSIVDTSASLYFVFLESNTYASVIQWSSIFSAGYPKEYSSDSPPQYSRLAGYEKAPNGFAFRGGSSSTLITATATQARHSVPVEGLTTTGYILDYVSSQQGSVSNTVSFNAVDGILVNFLFNRSLNSLVVEVDQVQTSSQFISSLLGAISGILGGLGALIIILESFETEMINRFSPDYVEFTDTVKRASLYQQFVALAIKNQTENPVNLDTGLFQDFDKYLEIQKKLADDNLKKAARDRKAKLHRVRTRKLIQNATQVLVLEDRAASTPLSLLFPQQNVELAKVPDTDNANNANNDTNATNTNVDKKLTRINEAEVSGLGNFSRSSITQVNITGTSPSIYNFDPSAPPPTQSPDSIESKEV